MRTGDLEWFLARLAGRLNISMRFFSKQAAVEMNHIAVLYTFDLILLDFAEYPPRKRNSERGKDRTVKVYLALLRPGRGGHSGGNRAISHSGLLSA